MAILITFLIVFALIITFCIILTKETNGNSLLVVFVFVMISWCMLENKTTDTADPVAIDKTKLSIMFDSDIAIIRYDGYNYTYDKVSQYNAIKDSTFSFMRIQEFDVFGKDNGSTYALKLK